MLGEKRVQKRFVSFKRQARNFAKRTSPFWNKLSRLLFIIEDSRTFSCI